MKHGTYDDFWKARNLRPHLKDIKPGRADRRRLVRRREPVRRAGDLQARSRTVSPRRRTSWSWARGTTAAGAAATARRSATSRSTPRRPSSTARRSSSRSSSTTSRARRSPTLPEAWVFETGTNQWRQYDAWPPEGAEPRSLYLLRRRAVSASTPAERGRGRRFDEYVSDPAKPVPFIDEIDIGMAREYMTPTSGSPRGGPTCWSTRPTSLDDDLTLAGPIEAELHVSTTGTDADWVVKLIDVYPDDYPDPEPEPDGRAAWAATSSSSAAT